MSCQSHERVTPVHMTRLEGLARDWTLTWCHIGASHTTFSSVTESRHLLWRDWRLNCLAPHVHQSRQRRRHDSIVLDCLV
jgi:hypothetical protein